MNSAIPQDSIASGMGVSVTNVVIKTNVSKLPVRLALLAQPSDAVAGVVYDIPRQILSAKEAGEIYGYGSQIHAMCKVHYHSKQSIGTIPLDVFPIQVVGDTASAPFEFTGAQTTTGSYVLKVGSKKLRYTLPKGTTAAEALQIVKDLLDSEFDLLVTAGAIAASAFTITAKWAGATGNEIGVSIEGVNYGISLANPVVMSGGAGEPDISNALTKFNERYTDVISAFNDAGTLDKLEAKNETLWAPMVARLFKAYHGRKDTDKTAVSVDTASRNIERTNCCFAVAGSPSTCGEIAASVATYVAIISNTNPPKPYMDAPIYGILAGDASVSQWDFAELDYILKRGCSTSYVDRGVLRIGDLVTTYTPTGEDNPGYRYLVDIVKIQLMLHGLTSTFKGEAWRGKILIPDEDIATNPEARKPKHAIATIAGLIDTWADMAVLKNRDYAKSNIIAEMDTNNGNRLNVGITNALSNSVRQKSIDMKFTTEVMGE